MIEKEPEQSSGLGTAAELHDSRTARRSHRSESPVQSRDGIDVAKTFSMPWVRQHRYTTYTQVQVTRAQPTPKSIQLTGTPALQAIRTKDELLPGRHVSPR